MSQRTKAFHITLAPRETPEIGLAADAGGGAGLGVAGIGGSFFGLGGRAALGHDLLMQRVGEAVD